MFLDQDAGDAEGVDQCSPRGAEVELRDEVREGDLTKDRGVRGQRSCRLEEPEVK